jgi:hypothetical protein
LGEERENWGLLTQELLSLAAETITDTLVLLQFLHARRASFGQ